ncbi:hypothetical protein ZWY2020_024840 [Hordeum vulgare]|nr:hypothetical protein ZWY2020_024840 [Hordeum vulgare]
MTGAAIPPEAKPPEEVRQEIGGIAGAVTEIDISADSFTTADDSHWRWEVFYIDTNLVSQTERRGFIYLHKESRWITVRDDEHDILAGIFLQHLDDPKNGDVLEVDGFRVSVRCKWAPKKIDIKPATVCDLTIDSKQFGGRFWVLADQDEEDEDGVELDNPPSDGLESPSSRIPATIAHGCKLAADFAMAKKMPAAISGLYSHKNGGRQSLAERGLAAHNGGSPATGIAEPDRGDPIPGGGGSRQRCVEEISAAAPREGRHGRLRADSWMLGASAAGLGWHAAVAAGRRRGSGEAPWGIEATTPVLEWQRNQAAL